VDTLVDIRRRRGVRGPQYAFANRARLEAGLEAAGIRYLHYLPLAPSEALIRLQGRADQQKGTPRRQRSSLSPEFLEHYNAEVLPAFDPQDFFQALPPGSHKVALLCVEGEPAACHRSLAAAHLSNRFGFPVEHLVPGD
jgi:hypothetical protein